MSNPKFQIFKGADGEYYFRLIARNGEPILKSEGYKAKIECENGIDSVKKNAPKDEQYQWKTAGNGQFYFNLVAGNGEIIGTSEAYTSEQARETGIEAVKNTALHAPVEDTTTL